MRFLTELHMRGFSVLLQILFFREHVPTDFIQSLRGCVKVFYRSTSLYAKETIVRQVGFEPTTRALKAREVNSY